jgi:hypothetical protein
MVTHTVRIIPMRQYCHGVVYPRRLRPFLIKVIIRAPKTLPTIPPRPPKNVVPPITEAAMASNSYPNPPVGWALAIRDASIMPAKLAMTPESI